VLISESIPSLVTEGSACAIKNQIITNMGKIELKIDCNDIDNDCARGGSVEGGARSRYQKSIDRGADCLGQ
jgi:hypothetical protein